MSREILFKGQRKSDREWIFGNLLWTDDGIFIIQNHVPYHLLGKYEVLEETVCEYAGLTDKNGRKIFEGDICRDSDNIVRVLWNDKHQWGVEISKTDNVLSKGLIFPLWQYDNCKENAYRMLEIIGNIFDNPELLKGDGDE